MIVFFEANKSIDHYFFVVVEVGGFTQGLLSSWSRERFGEFDKNKIGNIALL